MWNETTAKTFLLGCLYGFEKDNNKQILEFNCPNIGYLIDFTVLLRSLDVPYHIDKKGIRLLIITDRIQKFDFFLKNNFNLDYTYPLRTRWPEILEKDRNKLIPFVDGVFETAGLFTDLEDRFPFVLHLQNERTTEKISNIIQDFGIENIWVKNPNIRYLYTIQVMEGEKFLNTFLSTNPSSKYSRIIKKNK